MRTHPLLGAPAPPLGPPEAWLDGAPPSRPYRARLVLFWTFGCGNCIRTVPFVEAWHQRHASKGLEVVGVHSPEFDHEHDLRRVADAAFRLGATFPNLLDNDHRIWRAYANRYWPCAYLTDQEGIIRDVFVGEGRFREREERILALLAENGGILRQKPKNGPPSL